MDRRRERGGHGLEPLDVQPHLREECAPVHGRSSLFGVDDPWRYRLEFDQVPQGVETENHLARKKRGCVDRAGAYEASGLERRGVTPPGKPIRSALAEPEVDGRESPPGDVLPAWWRGIYVAQVDQEIDVVREGM